MLGVSSPEIRNKVVPYILETLKPRSVLDLGMGAGVYGMALKQGNPDIVMIGWDAWWPYLAGEIAQKFYDVRINAPISRWLDRTVRQLEELTICMDVIEHLEKPDALALMDELCGWYVAVAECCAIISTPLFDYKQGPMGGNPLEEHKCWFTEEEITGRGWKLLFKEAHTSWDGQTGYMGAFITPGE